MGEAAWKVRGGQYRLISVDDHLRITTLDDHPRTTMEEGRHRITMADGSRLTVEGICHPEHLHSNKADIQSPGEVRRNKATSSLRKLGMARQLMITEEVMAQMGLPRQDLQFQVGVWPYRMNSKCLRRVVNHQWQFPWNLLDKVHLITDLWDEICHPDLQLQEDNRHLLKGITSNKRLHRICMWVATVKHLHPKITTKMVVNLLRRTTMISSMPIMIRRVVAMRLILPDDHLLIPKCQISMPYQTGKELTREVHL